MGRDEPQSQTPTEFPRRPGSSTSADVEYLLSEMKKKIFIFKLMDILAGTRRPSDSYLACDFPECEANRKHLASLAGMFAARVGI